MSVGRLVLIVVATGLMHWSPVHAQELTNADSIPMHDAKRAPTPEGATSRSVLWTALPAATIVLAPVGLWFGPAAGYFYGGMPGRAWQGIGIRTVGLGAMIGAFGVCGWGCGPGDGAYNAAWAMFIGGGVLVLGSAIYDIETVGRAVRKRQSVQVLMLPPTPWGAPARLGVSVRF